VILDKVQDVSLQGLSVDANASAESALRFINAQDVLVTAPRLLTSTPAFLQIEGPNNQRIKIDGGDISKAAKVLSIGKDAHSAAVRVRE
jgi:hypothetical protein